MSTGTQDIAILANFPSQIQQVASVIAGTTLGPYIISVSCSYDSGCKDCKYSVAIDISTKPLEDAVMTAQGNAVSFFISFEPVKSWMQQTLPNFSSLFSATAIKIQNILTVVQSKGTITPEQKQELNAMLTTLQQGLALNSSQLQKGSAAMVTFIQRQNTALQLVQNVQSNLETETNAALQKMIMDAEAEPCGQGDAQNQFNVIKGVYNSTVSTFNTQFTTLSSYTNAADNAVKGLLGLVTDFIAQIENISKDLKTVQQGNLSVFMQKITTAMASQLWTQLAEEAKKELGTTNY